jgi:hypothetical protein
METAATIILFALTGMCAGTLHFALLRRNVDLIITGGSPLITVAAVLGRFTVTAGIFVLAAIFYGLAIVWMLTGFIVARTAAVRIAEGRA